MLAQKPQAVYEAAMIDAAQMRAARGLLNWTQKELAERSGASVATIKNVEAAVRDTRGSTLRAIQEAFEAAGVVFMEPGDMRTGGKGVRLKG